MIFCTCLQYLGSNCKRYHALRDRLRPGLLQGRGRGCRAALGRRRGLLREGAVVEPRDRFGRELAQP